MSVKDYPPPVGAKVRIDYGQDNPNNCLYHVRAHVDGKLVVRRWFKRKQRWNYEVLGAVWWHVYSRSGHIKVEVPS